MQNVSVHPDGPKQSEEALHDVSANVAQLHTQATDFEGTACTARPC